MIKREDMYDINDIRPGENVKCMILYFPEVNTYRIHDNPFTATDKFVFENIKVYMSDNTWGKQTVFDYASKWIELENCTTIPF